MAESVPTTLLRPLASALEPIQVEVARKLASALQGADSSEREFLSLSEQRLGPADYAKIQAALFFAKSLKSTDPHHPSMSAYFSHPLRVATFTLRLLVEPAPETVVMGLIHNVFEVSGIREHELSQAGFSEHAGAGIRLLTIDRSRQYDPVYLREFHRHIELFGRDLMLIRCVDRLDNLLSLQLVERTEAIARYLDLSEQFVVPMAGRLASDLGDYMLEVIAYMRATGCDPALREKYQSFLRESAGT